VNVDVAVALGVNVGLGVNVIVEVGVSVANKVEIFEAPEQARIAKVRI